MKASYLYLIFFIILNHSLVAQTKGNQGYDQQKLVQKQFEEIMRAREEMLKSLLNDDSFSDMNKRMSELMKRFSGEDFNLGTQSFFGGSVVGEYDWREDDKNRILMIKVKQIKDKPLDIKIEKGFIKIKGDVEEVSDNNSRKNKGNNIDNMISKIHFEREFSIPLDVDQTNPEFENTNGELLIKFKKKNPRKIGKELNKSNKNLIENKKSDTEEIDRKPIDIDKNEISI